LSRDGPQLGGKRESGKHHLAEDSVEGAGRDGSVMGQSKGQGQSELHASPHIHIWIKTFHIYGYISVWIRKKTATEFDLSLIIVIQFCPSASFPQGLS